MRRRLQLSDGLNPSANIHHLSPKSTQQHACAIAGSLWESNVLATTCKFVVELGDHLALCRPANPYKWPLEFSHLSCQKCSKGFHHQPPHWSLCIHTKPTEKRDLTVGAELSTNNASGLQVWAPQSRKYQTGELPGIACWQDGVETQLYVRWKGEDIWFVLCSLQMAPSSSQMSVKTVSQYSEENAEAIF